MSDLANKVYSVLREIFPSNFIEREHYVQYDGNKLFFDFFVRDLGILLEVQGRQHEEFVPFFHGSKEKFNNHKVRDNKKIGFVQDNEDLCLVRVYYNEDITYDLLLEKIDKALDEGVC